MLSNSIKMNPRFEQLVAEFRKKYGVMDAELAMSYELFALNFEVEDLKQEIADLKARLEKEVHKSFHRIPQIEPIFHPTKAPTIIPPPSIDDDWVQTGRETEAA